MRFLGELYSYKHIDSSVVFETLYLIIVFGHGTNEVSTYILQNFVIFNSFFGTFPYHC
jgi:hypothetical protein